MSMPWQWNTGIYIVEQGGMDFRLGSETYIGALVPLIDFECSST